MQQIIEDKKMGAEEIIDLSHYVKLLKRSWLSIFIFAALVTGLVVLVVLSLTPKYTATATLMIEAQEKKAVSIQEVIGIDSNQKEYYQTQFEIIKSNQIAERVIKQLDLINLEEFNGSLNTEPSLMDKIKEFPLFASLLAKPTVARSQEDADESIRQSVLGAFQSKLVITPVRNTQLVKISFTSENPKLAATIANAVGYAYIESNLESRLDATQYASGWITSRLNELKDQLSASEQVLSDFLVKEKLIDDSGIDALASQELTNLTQRLAEVRDERIATESAYTALSSTNVSDIAALASIPAISQHPQVVAIRAAELDAQNEVNELSKRYGAKHDKMIAAQARLKSVQSQARSTTKKLITGIGKELEAVRKQEVLLMQTIQDRKSEFQELTIKKSRYDALKREVETNRNVLNVFLTRQKETTATEDFNSTNARFTDEALIPQSSSGPKKKLIVVIALIASLGFAVLLVFITDAMKNTIDSPKGFEDKFGLIPIGAIPIVKARRFKKTPLDNTVLFDENEFPFGESIRSIRTSLILNNRTNKRLAITSSLGAEGKTTVAINISMAFAKLENTLLIDCDLRKPSIAERFGMKKYQQGLANHLVMNTELSDCLYKDDKSGLTVLPAGMIVTNAQELLSSTKFAQLLDSLEQQFDRIIIDTPPSLPVSDSLIIGQLAKSALVVIKANETKLDAVKKTFSKLLQHQVHIEGVVINKINAKQQQLDYSYKSYGYGEQQSS
jgi:capsular exopolysaccharide synthesis family protein